MIDDILDLKPDIPKDGEAPGIFKEAYALLCALEHVLHRD